MVNNNISNHTVFIDCRMLGSGGIGTYLESLLPYFLSETKCFLLCNKQNIFNEQINSLLKTNESKRIDCDVKPFSIDELIHFPKDILKIINTCSLYYSPYCNIPNKIKVPVYSTIHDVVFLDVPSLTSKTGVFIRKYFYQRAINKSNSIFTVSNFSAERIKKHLKTKNKQIIVTYNSVPEWFTDKKSQKIKKENTILFVGNIKKHKGLHTLLNAYKIVLQKINDLKLIIVGNAENFRTGDNEIPELIKQFNTDQIQFTGRISNEQLREYYKKTKLLIQPSLYEGFGMPPLEALYSGTNVVISDIPVFKEIYHDFPVTFFKTENEQDLADKIMNSLNIKTPEIPENIYSFKKTYSIIKKELFKNEY